MAVADQIAGYSHGFVNPLLYSLYGTKAFNDVKPGPKMAVVRRNFVNSENGDDGFATSARTFDVEVGTLHVTKGYDNMTGMGTPERGDVPHPVEIAPGESFRVLSEQ